MTRDNDDTSETIADDLVEHVGSLALGLRLAHERAADRAERRTPVILPPGAGLSTTRETEQRV